MPLIEIQVLKRDLQPLHQIHDRRGSKSFACPSGNAFFV